jgi:hypothetical protein
MLLRLDPWSCGEEEDVEDDRGWDIQSSERSSIQSFIVARGISKCGEDILVVVWFVYSQ